MPASIQSQAGSSFVPRLSWFARLLGDSRRTPRLDPDTLPEYLKQDLGLSAGRPFARRDPLRD
jgi:hypothetical protein